ncbi:MAG: Na(+)-translocating NADH-quinone reductase subunit C [Desulfocapsaceae bacterium]|nr:Na(+)-translocating NADH-quinone reductase subunit C [Desulfocapsaceae bacterium]
MVNITAAKPFYSVLVLAFFCSLMVAGAAVGLRPLQEENKALDMKKNILLAANLYDSTKSTEQLFANIETRMIELASGEFVTLENISPQDFDQRKAAMTSEMGLSLGDDEDIAGIGRVERYSLVYLVKSDDKLDQIVLPVRGKGLWSTLYGYIAIEEDLTTINGISFYEHGETPGLGGEIENPRWQAGWHDKKIYNEADEEVIRIGGKMGDKAEEHYVDGISGATLTTDGVDDIITFWFGENGFKPFLSQLEAQGGKIDG